MHLFTYGTLMFPEIWRRVAKQSCGRAAARLDGFRIGGVRNALFPAIARATETNYVQGVVYFDVDAAAMARLDAYESSFYDRCSVTPLLTDGSRLQCEAYVLSESQASIHLQGPWDAGRFEREALAEYLAQLEATGRHGHGSPAW